MTGIAIIDDCPLFHHAIELVLNKILDITLVDKSFNGYEFALKLIESNITPSIAIVDIHMPKMDGIALTQFITHRYPEIKIIGISKHKQLGAYTAIMEAGAMGFVTKCNIGYLSDEIAAVLRNEQYIDPLIHEDWCSYKSISAQRHQINEFNLSCKELEQIRLSVTGLTPEEIANITCQSVHSVHQRQKYIKEKTGLGSRLEQSMYAINQGFAKVYRL